MSIRFFIISIIIIVPCFATQAAAAPNSKTYTDSTAGMEFVWVEGGCFDIESRSQKRTGNKKAAKHTKCVDGYYIGKYEVTNKQYRLFKPSHNSTSHNGESLNDDTQPVAHVSWDDAGKYAEWLSGKSEKNTRLPTGAEWEYAARAGSTTSRFWGDKPNDACKYANVHDIKSKKKNKFRGSLHKCDDGYSVAAPVGLFTPNNFGLYDMLGNVWEWTADLYEANSNKASSKIAPKKKPTTSSYRIYRGGSWDGRPEHVNSAFQSKIPPTAHYFNLGFRLVLTTK